jgi:hypothetical protein
MSLKLKIQFFGLLLVSLPRLCLSEQLNLPKYSTDIKLMQSLQLEVPLTDEISVYTWNWNNLADANGTSIYPARGLLANEIKKYYPDYVQTNDEGFLEIEFEHLLGVDQKICEFLLKGGTPYCWQIGR